MPSPPHVAAFQKFADQIPNHLEACIAFGLFMESERIWAANQGSLTEAKYRNYQEALLNHHEIERYAIQASEFLSKFGNDAVASKREAFLQASLEQYKAASEKGHSTFRKWGSQRR